MQRNAHAATARTAWAGVMGRIETVFVPRKGSADTAQAAPKAGPQTASKSAKSDGSKAAATSRTTPVRPEPDKGRMTNVELLLQSLECLAIAERTRVVDALAPRQLLAVRSFRCAFGLDLR